MVKFQLIFLVAIASQIFAAPQDSGVIYHCPDPEWTCCGPLLQDIGGTCRKLKSGEVCLF
ncbi:hypothetical protein M413DRAFT_447833 [Hebeloma cylindrosporum]|uniref:Uncharacterized protein n=1 Tax=Hebeloma cylindrosporum TaxID=76867 RepID=A0A0C3C409_HEBCY|nr:hypothetical protein M413DRAFT_447833 [Hebeloma cylindrosporum h7]